MGRESGRDSRRKEGGRGKAGRKEEVAIDSKTRERRQRETGGSGTGDGRRTEAEIGRAEN